MPQCKNARRYPRYRCRGDAQLQLEGITKAQERELGQISQGGCYVVTEDPLPLRTKLDLDLQVGVLRLQTRGVVLYSHPGQGMGVGFTHTAKEADGNIDGIKIVVEAMGKKMLELEANQMYIIELLNRPQGQRPGFPKP